MFFHAKARSETQGAKKKQIQALNAHRSPPTAHRSLLTAHRSLPTAHCFPCRTTGRRIHAAKMKDPNSESLTQPLDISAAKTAELRRVHADKTEEDFRAGQSRVLEMIAANAPLSKILTRLVLLIEEQSPDMLCSVLLLSDDGNHIRHGAAPSLPEQYVKAIDGTPLGPKSGSCGTAMYRGVPVIVSDILLDPLWEDYRELAAA